MPGRGASGEAPWVCGWLLGGYGPRSQQWNGGANGLAGEQWWPLNGPTAAWVSFTPLAREVDLRGQRRKGRGPLCVPARA
eukprot:6480836-Amphidinium_carterae.1